MDLYDDNEHVISSDEYSDDDDDDDALMNDAVRAHDLNIRTSEYFDRNKHPNQRIDQKQKQLSSLIRRNKISVIYKNKSIKWLNNKSHRERYKKQIYLNTKKFQITPSFSGQENQFNLMKTCDTIHTQDVSIRDDKNDLSNNKAIIKEDEVLQKVSLTYNADEHPKKGTQFADVKNTTEKKIEQITELSPKHEKIKEIPEKRSRSSTPSILNESNETEIKHKEKKFRAESPQFFKSINDMFPKFDKIVTHHVDTITNSTLIATEEKMKCLSNEIETLKDILQTKETEWKRLLHLKLVKQEIYSRLNQKMLILQSKDNCFKHGENSLLELKELENYLSENKEVGSETNNSGATIQKLIENRANMNAEDLRREKNNTSRLHNLLVSRNLLHGVESTENNSGISNGDKSGHRVDNHIDELNTFSNKGRQGEIKDVKSIIVDFRQKNPELLPRVGKRIKSSESNPLYQSFSIPKYEKSLSLPQYFTKDHHQSELYPLRNSVDEISFAPVGRVKKLSSSQDIEFANTMNNYNVRSEENYVKSQLKTVGEKFSKNIQYPLCQECKNNESRFVCAGCGNQWYCSKKCQISAWDKHSEQCTE